MHRVLIGLLLYASAAAAQLPDKSRVLAAARDVMQRARFATLITIGDGGHPQARIVDPLLPDAAMTIWVGSNPLTRKVAEIRRDPKVTLMYFDAKTNEYVSILALASVVTDRAEKAKHWKAEWGPFYRNGAAGDDFVLIRVRPSRLEIVSPTHKLVNDTLTWRPVSVSVP
jgi:pyridoxamine 5'-phosphate oxidase